MLSTMPSYSTLRLRRLAYLHSLCLYRNSLKYFNLFGRKWSVVVLCIKSSLDQQGFNSFKVKSRPISFDFVFQELNVGLQTSNYSSEQRSNKNITTLYTLSIKWSRMYIVHWDCWLSWTSALPRFWIHVYFFWKTLYQRFYIII